MISPVAMFFSSYAMVETYSLNGRFSSLATANPAASTSAILLQFLSATVISMDNGGHGMISSLIHPASTIDAAAHNNMLFNASTLSSLHYYFEPVIVTVDIEI